MVAAAVSAYGGRGARRSACMRGDEVGAVKSVTAHDTGSPGATAGLDA